MTRKKIRLSFDIWRFCSKYLADVLYQECSFFSQQKNRFDIWRFRSRYLADELYQVCFCFFLLNRKKAFGMMSVAALSL